MSAYPMPRAVASTATRERVREAVERVSTVSLEPHARVGTVLIYGPEGFQSATFARESVDLLEAWTLVVGVADERERKAPWSFLEVVNSSLARYGVHVATPLSAPDVPDDPVAVGRDISNALAGIDGPVCLMLENIHFADDRSADAMRFAVRRHSTQPRLAVMSSETLTGPTEQLLQVLAQSHPDRNVVVELPPLAPADVQELAVEIVARPLAGRVARRFAADADGNPTLVAELLAAYKDELTSAIHPGSVDLDRGRVVPLLPHQRRALEFAAPGVRTAAEVVAVLRDPTAIASVSRVAAWLGLTDVFGAFDLEGAQQAGLVRVVEDATVPTVAPPTRVAADSLAAGISLERRRAIHSAAAEVLTGVSVLRHRIGAADPDDVTLVADLIEAARTLATVVDAERALTLALSAVRLAVPGDEYEGALLFAGVLALRLHEHQRLFPLKGELAALPPSALRDVILADLEVLAGNRDAGIERAEAVIASADDSPTGRALRAHAAAMIPLYDAINDRHELVTGHTAAARRLLAQAPIDPKEVEPDLRWLVRPGENELWLAAWELAAAARLRDSERLSEWMSRLDLLVRATPHSPAAVDATVYQARTLIYAGRVADGANRLHRAIRVAAGFPGSWMRHIALTMHAHVLFLMGDWEQSLATGQAALDSAFDDPYRATLPVAYAVSGLVPAARGDRAAVERIERLLALLPPSGGGAVPYDPDLPDIMRAELAAALGDAAAQLRATETARTAARHGTAWNWLQLHVDALATLGRVAEARSIANEALSGQTPWMRSPHSVSRLRARVALASGDLAQALALYGGIVQSNTAATLPFFLARDRVSYAETLRLTGDRQRALEQLELAANGFRSLGARTYLLRALELAAALTETVRRESPGGTAARASEGAPALGLARSSTASRAALEELTTREREVAVAVANGLTNREVAELLYVSVTTVNFHVRNILSKLSLSSRRELRTLLRGSDGGR